MENLVNIETRGKYDPKIFFLFWKSEIGYKSTRIRGVITYIGC